MTEAQLVLVEERVKRQLQKAKLMTPSKRQRLQDTIDLIAEVRQCWAAIANAGGESQRRGVSEVERKVNDFVETSFRVMAAQGHR